MKTKILTILHLSFLLLSITGCSLNKKFEPVEIDGIIMTIKDGTLTNKSARIIIKDTNEKDKYAYGVWFRIDKKENGKWIKIKEIGNECIFDAMIYNVDDDGLLEFEQNWSCLYGELENGTYRLVKNTFIRSEKPITKDDIKYFSIEFNLE